MFRREKGEDIVYLLHYVVYHASHLHLSAECETLYGSQKEADNIGPASSYIYYLAVR